MQQRTFITRSEDISNIAKRHYYIFQQKNRFSKVQLNQFSEAENFEIEKKLVKMYSLGQHGFWTILPIYTILVYLLMVLINIIPYNELGAVPTILLYAPFALVAILLLRVFATLYARRSLLKLANELHTTPSFMFA